MKLSGMFESLDLDMKIIWNYHFELAWEEWHRMIGETSVSVWNAAEAYSSSILKDLVVGTHCSLQDGQEMWDM